MDGAVEARTGRRIPSEVWEARLRAQEVLAAAEAEAVRLRAGAEAEVAAAREAGEREGWARGLAEAAAEVLRGARERERLVAGCRDELVALARAMAERILRREVRVGEDAVRLAERGISELRGLRRVVLRVTPGDAAAASALPARVVPDPALAPGEVVVEAEGVRVDGRFQAQLDEIVRALRETEATEGRDAAGPGEGS